LAGAADEVDPAGWGSLATRAPQSGQNLAPAPVGLPHAGQKREALCAEGVSPIESQNCRNQGQASSRTGAWDERAERPIAQFVKQRRALDSSRRRPSSGFPRPLLRSQSNESCIARDRRDRFALSKALIDCEQPRVLEPSGVGAEVAVGELRSLAQVDEFLRRFGGQGCQNPQAAGVGNQSIKSHISIIGRSVGIA